jgi:DNA-binding winged helix-turn-helix (wHTH) protein
MPRIAQERVHFGLYELDAHAGELYKQGLKLKLQGHQIQIPAMLLERPGELITREEIQQKLWPTESDTFVDFEHGLNTAVRKLRQALGDEAETPHYIETLPRRGYRFVGQIANEEAAQLLAKDSTDAEHTSGKKASEPAQNAWRKLPYHPLFSLALLAVLLGAALWVLRDKWARHTPLQVISTKQITLSGMLDSPTGPSENYRSIQTDGRRVYFATNIPQRLLLGHDSIQTTERSLGTEQNLTVAVNDVLGLEMD